MGEDWYSDDKATMGDRITAAREHAQMDCVTLSRKLGVRETTLQGWENDEREPRANHIRMLAGMLGVSLIWLLTGEGDGLSVAGPGSSGAAREAALTEIRVLQRTMRETSRRLARLEKLLNDV